VDPAGATARKRKQACIALGSNVGDRDAHIAAAISALRRTPEIEVVALSRIYETDPVGPPQAPYLNAVARLAIDFEADELLARMQEIELERGRRRSAERNGPRTLDLDLLLFDDECIDRPGLVVPHPRLHERAFVLEPLRDVAPDWRHPLLGITIEDLAFRVRDPAAVRLREGAADEASNNIL